MVLQAVGLLQYLEGQLVAEVLQQVAQQVEVQQVEPAVVQQVEVEPFVAELQLRSFPFQPIHH